MRVGNGWQPPTASSHARLQNVPSNATDASLPRRPSPPSLPLARLSKTRVALVSSRREMCPIATSMDSSGSSVRRNQRRLKDTASCDINDLQKRMLNYAPFPSQSSIFLCASAFEPTSESTIATWQCVEETLEFVCKYPANFMGHWRRTIEVPIPLSSVVIGERLESAICRDV